MAENSKIEWTDHTFNPWIGCTRVSPGCANCYAEALMDTRYGKVKWGKGQKRVRTSAANWKLPVRWNLEAEVRRVGELHSVPAGEDHNFVRPRVFCASLADWLDEEVEIKDLVDLLKLIQKTPNLDWLLLTKRPENFLDRIFKVIVDCTSVESDALCYWLHHWQLSGSDHAGVRSRHSPPENVWIGTTVENQEYADKRIPELLKIPAKLRFLSVEPMLGEVDLTKIKQTVEHGFFGDCLGWHHRGRCHEGTHYPQVHWVICGGESGPANKRRPMQLEWARSLREQCAEAQVPFFMKQIDKVQPIPDDLMIRQYPKLSR